MTEYDENIFSGEIIGPPRQIEGADWVYEVEVFEQNSRRTVPARFFWEGGVEPLSCDEGFVRVGIDDEGQVTHVEEGGLYSQHRYDSYPDSYPTH